MTGGGESFKAARAAEGTAASGAGSPKISVVTVVLNGEKTIECALRSVVGQSYPNVELIVVDGGSTDGTLAIIGRYRARISRLVSEKDRGIYDAMNKGIGMATGDLVGFLNSDDWYTPEALEAVAAAWRRRRTDDLAVAGKCNMIHEDIGLVVNTTPSLDFSIGMPISHQALFVPKSVYERVGPYDAGFRLAGDLDMAVRLHRRGIEFHFLDETVVNYRVGGNSMRHYRESFREATSILRRSMPPATYWRFRLFRVKFDLLCRLDGGIERILGTTAAGSLRRRYFRLKSRFGAKIKVSAID